MYKCWICDGDASGDPDELVCSSCYQKIQKYGGEMAAEDFMNSMGEYSEYPSAQQSIVRDIRKMIGLE